MEVKGVKEREKKEKDLNAKVKAKKITETKKQMELKIFDQVLENRIQNEIAKRIDKAYTYSFNLANYKSTLSESQIEEWNETLKDIQPNGAATVEEVYKKLNTSKPENILSYLLKLNPVNALEADIAREYIANVDEAIIKRHKELASISDIIMSGAKYPIVKLKKYLILNENKIKPSKNHELNYKVLGVSNEIGIFLNENLIAEETNQSYYIVQKNQFCYNPYRINVGSIGLNNYDFENQIISGAYIVFGCKEDELNPKYLDTQFKSKGFLDYVNDKANGGVRMNFKFEDMETWEIPLPTIDEQAVIVSQIKNQRAIIEGAESIDKNWSIDFDCYLSRYKFNQKTLSELIVESLYGSSKKADYQVEGYNVLRIGNIGFCDFKLKDIKKAILTKKEFKKYRLEKGDFLIVRSNGNPDLVGKCAVWKEKIPFVYASYLIRFRYDLDQVEPRYIMYFLMSPNGRSILKPQAGGGTYNISATEFQKAQIPLPDLNIQRLIIGELDNKLDILKDLHKLKTEAERKINQILADIWGIEYVEQNEKEVNE